MNRRPWFQLTDKIQDAHLVWTQIKVPSMFQIQKKGEPLIKFQEYGNSNGLDTLI